MKIHFKIILTILMSSFLCAERSTARVIPKPPVKVANNSTKDAASQKSPLNGFALGLQAGYTILRSPAKFSSNSGGNPASVNLAVSGFFGGLLIGGYTDIGDTMNLGVDLQYSMSNASGTIDNMSMPLTPYKVTLKVKDIITAAVRLGWRVGKVVPYVKLGAASSSLQARAEIPPGNASSTVFTKKHRSFGALGGGGVDFCMDGCTTVGVEMLVAKYNNFKMSQPLHANNYQYSFSPMIYSASLVVKCFF